MNYNFFVYIVTNMPNGILYIGMTNDIGRRAWEHRDGAVPGFTKMYGLKRLVLVERYSHVDEAIWREKRLKTWNRAWKVRLIQRSNPDWADLYETVSM